MNELPETLMTNKFKSARLGSEGIGAVTRLGRMMDLTLEMSMNWSDATWPRRVSSHKISQIFVEKKPCCPKLLLAYKSKLQSTAVKLLHCKLPPLIRPLPLHLHLPLQLHRINDVFCLKKSVRCTAKALA